MSQFPDRLFFRLALIGALAAALGLAACGRKGALDPPPSTVSATDQQAPANTALVRSPFERPGARTESTVEETESTAAKTPDEPFILDSLLN